MPVYNFEDMVISKNRPWGYEVAVPTPVYGDIDDLTTVDDEPTLASNIIEVTTEA